MKRMKWLPVLVLSLMLPLPRAAEAKHFPELKLVGTPTAVMGVVVLGGDLWRVVADAQPSTTIGIVNIVAGGASGAVGTYFVTQRERGTGFVELGTIFIVSGVVQLGYGLWELRRESIADDVSEDESQVESMSSLSFSVTPVSAGVVWNF